MTSPYEAFAKTNYLSRNIVLRLLKKRTFVVTTNGHWWSPFRGQWLFTTQYFRWDQFTFGVLWMKSNIDDLIFSLIFCRKLIYWLNMSFDHHICSCLIVFLVLISSFSITHNWLGSLRDIFWLLTILWSNCEEVIIYSWRWQNMIYRISCWTFVDPNWVEVSFPYNPS